jgi:HEAT repeat protein
VLTTKLHDFENRALAATMLGWFGVAARSALPALVDLASFMNNATWEARRAVLRIGSAESEVLRQFEEALTRGDDGAVRNLFTLGIHLGMQQVPTFQALVRSAAKSPSVHMRDAATDMIASLNPTRRKAYLRVLRQLAEDTDPGIRAAAAEALAEVLPTA